MKFLVFKINDLTGLSQKDKFTEHRLTEMIKNVMSIEERFNGKTIKSIDVMDDSVEECWNDYLLVKKVLQITKK